MEKCQGKTDVLKSNTAPAHSLAFYLDRPLNTERVLYLCQGICYNNRKRHCTLFDRGGDTMIYFTSDLHFYHDNIIRHTNRPYHGFEEMNKALVRNWNQRVNPQDEVYILGDVTMKGPAYAAGMLGQLKGRKYLIRGNHDNFMDSREFDLSVFGWIKDYHELTWQNQKFILFHYPIEEWNGYFCGTIQLHGHQHNHLEIKLFIGHADLTGRTI